MRAHSEIIVARAELLTVLEAESSAPVEPRCPPHMAMLLPFRSGLVATTCDASVSLHGEGQWCAGVGVNRDALAGVLRKGRGSTVMLLAVAKRLLIDGKTWLDTIQMPLPGFRSAAPYEQRRLFPAPIDLSHLAAKPLRGRASQKPADGLPLFRGG